MNKCISCKQEKPLNEFKKYGDEYSLSCRACLEKQRGYYRSRKIPNVYYVYGLFDPLTSRCRYIGKTQTPVIRFNGHLTEARNHDGYNKRKDEWINSLVKIGEKPIMAILQQTDKHHIDTIEAEWCYKLSEMGADLLNSFRVLHK